MQSSLFAVAKDASPMELSDQLQAKGRERHTTESLESLDRELARKSRTIRAAINKRGVKTRGRANAKKTRGRFRDNHGPNNGGKSDNKNGDGKGKSEKPKKNVEKKDEGKKPSASGMLYYPNFDMMACVADGMPPPYFSSTYFSSSAQECCAVHFTGMAAECTMVSTGGMNGGGGGGFILAVNHQTSGASNGGSSAWMGSTGGKSGKTGGIGSSGYSWMGSTGGKSGKAGGKAGKSVEANPWVGNPLIGSADGVIKSHPMIGSSTGGAVNMPWGGAMMILQTEEPSYTPTYMPTTVRYYCNPSIASIVFACAVIHCHSLLFQYTPTTYIPTYIPTHDPTEASFGPTDVMYRPIQACTPQREQRCCNDPPSNSMDLVRKCKKWGCTCRGIRGSKLPNPKRKVNKQQGFKRNGSRKQGSKQRGSRKKQKSRPREV